MSGQVTTFVILSLSHYVVFWCTLSVSPSSCNVTMSSSGAPSLCLHHTCRNHLSLPFNNQADWMQSQQFSELCTFSCLSVSSIGADTFVFCLTSTHACSTVISATSHCRYIRHLLTQLAWSFSSLVVNCNSFPDVTSSSAVLHDELAIHRLPSSLIHCLSTHF